MSRTVDNKSNLVISYMSLRKAIGTLGLLLPFVLVLGNVIAGEPAVLYSLSNYYHSNAAYVRDIFVAVLCAIAVFSFSYRGYERKDDIAGDITGLAALGIAFFPATERVVSLAETGWVGTVHVVAAAVFFLTLAYFSLVLFTKSNPAKPMTPRKKSRNRVYRLCGYTILLCLILVAVYRLILEGRFPDLQAWQPVFWLESLAIVAFGISWLTKGEAILGDIK